MFYKKLCIIMLYGVLIILYIVLSGMIDLKSYKIIYLKVLNYN